MVRLAASFVALLACLLPSATVLAAPSYPFASILAARQDAPINTTTAAASPSSADYTADVPLHSSCNATQSMQIRAGFEEMKTLASTAIDHINRNGIDDLFKLYFGEAGDSAPVVGVLQRMIDANKAGMVIRCDDPDNQCYQDGWAGYWRTEVTAETNICDLSFFTRRSLNTICGFGFTVAGSNSNELWGADLLHRMFHIPQLTHEKILHVADPYDECLELAKSKPEETVRNQHSLQFFALDVYARKHVPGGCTGEPLPQVEAAEAPAAGANASSGAVDSAAQGARECHDHADGTTHCEGGATSSNASAASSAEPAAASAEQPAECHTHDGEIHCDEH